MIKKLSLTILFIIIAGCSKFEFVHDKSLKNNYEFLFDNSFVEKELDNNWRSAINIVEFNNWFFTQVVKDLDFPSIQKAYTNLISNFLYHEDLVKILPYVINKKGIINNEIRELQVARKVR